MSFKKILLFLIAVVLLFIAGCSGSNEVAVIETAEGNIVISFHEKAAPKHVARFKQLAREGFYDGVLWHRVIPSFIVQAGDPMTKDPNTPRGLYGTHGTGKSLKAEFSDLKHVRGVVGMSRTAEISSADSQFFDTADSQFYILLGDKPHLDGKYTIFGEVISGMDVVDKISSVERDIHNVPLMDQQIISIKIVKRSELESEK